jgi:hypothetical protein
MALETLLTSCIEDARTDKKRKAVTLTVDNADVVFAECFDLNAYIYTYSLANPGSARAG